MKTLQNILIVVVVALILAGMYTDGWLSVGLSAVAALVAVAALAFSHNGKNKK